MMTTELAPTNGNGHAPMMSVQEALTLAEHFARSGYFADAKQASQAVVKIIAGRELGIGPMAAMSGIHLVQGKPALSAGLIGALIARSGRYRYEVLKCDNDGAELEWYRDGVVIGRSSFTIKDAELAGLAGKGTWKQYPSDLCFARALTRGARRFCPDVSMGPAYTPEELGGGMVPDVAIDPATGEIVDATPRQLTDESTTNAEPTDHYGPMVTAATSVGGVLEVAKAALVNLPDGHHLSGALRLAFVRAYSLCEYPADYDRVVAAHDFAKGKLVNGDKKQAEAARAAALERVEVDVEDALGVVDEPVPA